MHHRFAFKHDYWYKLFSNFFDRFDRSEQITTKTKNMHSVYILKGLFLGFKLQLFFRKHTLKYVSIMQVIDY